ncbi:MAG: hypothetical protein WAK82_40215 [Streptosporangiaceae bacterium]
MPDSWPDWTSRLDWQVYALLKEEIIRVDRQPGDLLGEAGLAELQGDRASPLDVGYGGFAGLEYVPD